MARVEREVSALEASQSLYAKAETLARVKEREFNEGLKKQREGEWYLTMLKKGTATDKISSLAMLVQQDPYSTLPYLMQLLGLAKKPNRKMAEQAIVAFKDLFVRGYLIKEEHLNQKL